MQEPRTRAKMQEPIGVGVIGAGLWGHTHAQVYAAHHRSRLVAVCDTNAEKAELLGSKYGVNWYVDIDKMLEEPSLQAVSIATPDFAHRSPVVTTANAGKHILLEKPLATTLEDVRAISDAVTCNSIRLMVDFHSRWSPPLAIVKQSVQDGQVGKVVSAYYRLNDTISVPLELLSWASKSSILWFLGSHAVDTLRWLIGDDVSRVYSVARSGVLQSKGLDVPDIYQAILEFRSGAIATIENNWILPNTHPNINDIKLNILGTQGMLDLDLTNHGVVQRFLRDSYDQPDVFVHPNVHGKVMGFATESIRDFINCLADGKEFITDITDGVKCTETILAIMRSAESGLPESLD